jgi:hypothetical protein
MIDATLNYAFVDYPDKEQIIHGHEVVNRLGWVGVTTYYRYDGVTYDGEDYIALATNSNILPGTDPTIWSILVEVDATASPGQSGVDLVARAIATSGSNLAWEIYTGTNFIRNEDAQVFCHHISWGTGTNNVNATQMPYDNPTYQTVATALDALLYVPLQLTSFSNNINTVEIGGSTTNVVLTWAYNKAVTAQSINQGFGSLPVGQRTATDGSTFSTNRTYSLTATDGSTPVNGSTSVTFMQKRYWGTSANTTLNDAQIIALNSEFASSRSQSRIITAAAEYIYFAYPASFGTASFTVNGLPNTAWTLVTRAFVNASGYSESYNIYRSNNLLTGTYTIVVS